MVARPQRSQWWSGAVSPDACSGLMYPGVPKIELAAVTKADDGGDPFDESNARAIPKSRSFTVDATLSSRVRKRFAGLRSRWATSCAWAWARPRAAWRTTAATRKGGIAP